MVLYGTSVHSNSPHRQEEAVSIPGLGIAISAVQFPPETSYSTTVNSFSGTEWNPFMIPIPCNLFVLEIQVAGLHCRKGGWSGRTLQRSTLGCSLPLTAVYPAKPALSAIISLHTWVGTVPGKSGTLATINANYYGRFKLGQAVRIESLDHISVRA